MKASLCDEDRMRTAKEADTIYPARFRQDCQWYTDGTVMLLAQKCLEIQTYAGYVAGQKRRDLSRDTYTITLA